MLYCASIAVSHSFSSPFLQSFNYLSVPPGPAPKDVMRGCKNRIYCYDEAEAPTDAQSCNWNKNVLPLAEYKNFPAKVQHSKDH